MKSRVVITGVGVLAGNGKGKQEYWQSLRQGKVGYKPITIFDASEFRVKIAGEISDFDPTIYMGVKGLRLLDRSTKLMVSSAKLCIQDSQYIITEENTDDCGVSVGTTLGSLKSIAEFDEVTLREGPRYVNPGLFPNTVINSPASQISIWHKIKGFNTTISTGFTSSLDAMSYAYDFLQYGRANVIYTGSVEELCWHTFFGFHTLEFLSGSKEGQEFVNCPFDARRNGITFGEGACLLCFEDYDHAIARNAPIQAEVLGFGTCFDPFKIHKYNPHGTGLKQSIRNALEDAGVGIEDIDYICANANSTKMADKVETEAIKAVFGERAYKIPISAVKSMTGECYSLSGAFAMAASVGVFQENFIPPTVNYKEKDPDCDLDYVPNEARDGSKIKTILVITFGPNGNNTCAVIKRFEQ